MTTINITKPINALDDAIIFLEHVTLCCVDELRKDVTPVADARWYERAITTASSKLLLCGKELIELRLLGEQDSREAKKHLMRARMHLGRARDALVDSFPSLVSRENGISRVYECLLFAAFRHTDNAMNVLTGKQDDV